MVGHSHDSQVFPSADIICLHGAYMDLAMARELFTATRIADMQCKPGRNQSIYWDGKTPGLGLRVTTGAKSYIHPWSQRWMIRSDA